MTTLDPKLDVTPLRSSLAGAAPRVVEEISRTVVCQYMTGLLVQPTHAMCSEVLLSVTPGIFYEDDRLPNNLLYRVIFHAELPAIGTQFWMVVIGAREPANGVIDGTCKWSRAHLFVHTPEGWVEQDIYDHRWVHAQPSPLPPAEGAFPDPLDEPFIRLRF